MREGPSDRIPTVVGLASAVGALAAGATVAGFLGPLAWWLELAAHFRVQYFVALAGVALLLATMQKFRAAAVYAVFAVVNLAVVFPSYAGPDAPAVPDGSPRFRAMLLNVFTANEDGAAVLDAILQADPDVIVVEEVNDRWLQQLEPVSRTHPFGAHQTREDNFGIALFSRLPIEGARVVSLGRARVPSVFGWVDVGGRRVAVLGTHALPPISSLYASLRNDQIDAVARFAAEVDGPILLLGDLNTSPWTPRFRRLLHEADLRDSLAGRGLQASWPAEIWPLRIPIDHVLHSEGLWIVDRRLGPFVGSDHYPVIVDVARVP